MAIYFLILVVCMLSIVECHLLWPFSLLNQDFPSTTKNIIENSKIIGCKVQRGQH